MNINEAKDILRACIAEYRRYQPEEFTKRDLQQLESCQLGYFDEEDVVPDEAIRVYLPQFNGDQITMRLPEALEAYVWFRHERQEITGAQLSIVYEGKVIDTVHFHQTDDVLCAQILGALIHAQSDVM